MLRCIVSYFWETGRVKKNPLKRLCRTPGSLAMLYTLNSNPTPNFMCNKRKTSRQNGLEHAPRWAKVAVVGATSVVPLP